MAFLAILVVVLLILLNGFFAFAEFALVSSRRGRLEQLAADGRGGAQTAVALADDPARVLATVQIGMTFTQTLAGAFSGATLAGRLEDWLASFPLVAAYGKPVAVAAIVIIVAYLTLVFGEFVPKNVALATSGSGRDAGRPAARLVRARGRPARLPARRVDPLRAAMRGRTARSAANGDRRGHPQSRRRGGAAGRDPPRRARHDRGRARPRRQRAAHDHDAAAGRGVGRPRRSTGRGRAEDRGVPARANTGMPWFDRRAPRGGAQAGFCSTNASRAVRSTLSRRSMRR